MKKLLALVAATFAFTTLSAQTGVGTTVNYYGIDFSRTGVFGAAETGYQFKEAFGRINALIIAEWPKYNLEKFLHKDIAVMNISTTELLNNEIDPLEVAVSSPDYYISKDEIADMVRQYEIQEEDGTGLVIIGELLDKTTYNGVFVVIYFDIATREVLHGEGMVGQAGGFGLRNYWAGALLDALKRLR
jgi:hypothetical protein